MPVGRHATACSPILWSRCRKRPPTISSRPRPERSLSGARCCPSPTRPESSTSRAASASWASSSSRPAAPPARSPTRASRTASITDFTGFPEIMDGRVKTLHPKLYAGLLAVRDDESHLAAATSGRGRDGRPRVRQPLSVRADRRPPRRRRLRGDREHRHRRPDDDPRGGEELRLRGAGRLARVLRRDPRRAARERQQAVAGDARVARGGGVRLHRPLRHRDHALVLREARRRLPAAVRARLREGHRPLLRREPAPARRLLRPGRLADAPAQQRAPARRQAAVVQQPARPQRRAPARARVPGAVVRDRQAQQPVRRGDRRHARSTPTSGRSSATRSPPSAA